MRKKLIRFEANKGADNILERSKPLYDSIKGRWNELYFKNDQPITLEVGAGRGEYTIGLAREFPDRNFVGLDYKGDRLWYGSQAAIEEDLSNVGFLRERAERIDDFFGTNEVSEIWITFPGPRPKNTEEHRRLTSDRFLNSYKKILKPGGIVHLKTDSDLVYEYTLQQIKRRKDIELVKKTGDLYASGLLEGHYGIQTNFEKRFLKDGKTIKYVVFRYLTKRRFLTTMMALWDALRMHG